jgi:hypothetical protein
MTLLLSLTHPNAIVMSADSRKTTTLTPIDYNTMKPIGASRTEFSTTKKLFPIKGIGCITMWGDLTRIEKKVPTFLQSLSVSSVEELAEKVLEFLKQEVVKETDEDVGFHVGGYSSDGKQRLYHVFYGKDVGPGVDPNNNPQKFAKYDHSEFLALYNGKHEIAHSVISFLLALEKEVGIVKWITQHPLEKAITFSQFILKYASQIDPTVGNEIQTAIITPRNEIEIKSSSAPEVVDIPKENKNNYSPLPSGLSVDSNSEGTASRGY